MPVIYSNNASTTLSAGINNSTTTIGIASASGFPSIGSGEYYFATIANTNNTKIEVVKVTAGTTSLTVTRAQDGTTAQAFDSGDNFQLRVTAATLGAATKTDVNITGGAIAGAAISNDAIDSQHYADGSIDTAHIADDAVTTAKIADDNVTAAKLANSINTDIATGVTANTTANAALPKAGGAMTGNLTSSAEIRIGTTQEFNSLNGRGNLVVGSGSGNEGMTIYSGASNQGGIIFADGVSSADAYEGQIQYDHSDDSMRFYVNDGTEKMRIKSTGATEFTNSVITGTNTDATNTGSVTLDFAANQNFVLTLTGNVTLANPSTEQVGQSGFITFIQDGTGGRTVALGTNYETAGGAGLTLTSTASATDIVPYVVVAVNRILLGAPQLAFV